MLHIESTWADLPPVFWDAVAPSAAREPRLLTLNRALADELGLDLAGLDDAGLARLLSGLDVPSGARPVAMAYAGHQFGHFVPQLGDGRAILLGEIIGPDQRRHDIHLKGAGRSRFSRGGDGRAALGPALREWIVSEAMHALGVPTTRTLAVTLTGDTVPRERLHPGAVVARVGASHIRFGTFEYFASRRDHDNLRILADYTIARHDPDLAGHEDRFFAFFARVCTRTLALVAQWYRVGFVHGVMNTDNMTVSGETLDFGPCAFLDTFRFDQVFSSIDHGGRYRFGNQHRIAIWNLSVFANCVLTLVGPDEDRAVDRLRAHIDTLDAEWEEHWLRAMAPKLGIVEPRDSDAPLLRGVLEHIQDAALDYAIAFRELARGNDLVAGPHAAPWRARVDAQPGGLAAAQQRMRAANPARIPRNHRIEQIIDAALAGDLAPAHRLHAALAHPYDDDPVFADLETPPTPDEVVEATYCGT